MGAAGSELSPGLTCSPGFPDAHVRHIAAIMDGSAILHNTFWRDCSFPILPGVGTVFVTSVLPGGKVVVPPEIYMHESGHFLHELADEYACDGGHVGFSDPKNVFASENECKDAVAKAALPGTCKEMLDRGTGTQCPDGNRFWHLDNGTVGLMTKSDDTNIEWQGFSLLVVTQRFAACRNGSCY